VITVCDDLGRQITLAAAPRRIVSLVPSLTETLFRIGCGDQLVGVTRYCTEPAGMVERVERVGGTKNPDVARICALAPDFVLVNAEENRKADADALEGAGLRLFVTFPRLVRDMSQLLRNLGTLTGAAEPADRLADELCDTLEHLPPATDRGPRVFCPIWKNPWMSFNQETFAHDMLWIAGGRNVCADRPERYCTVTLDEVAAAKPDVILLPDEPYVFRSRDLAALRELEATPAWQAQRVHFIDGKALSWYGPRTAPGLRYLRAILSRA
jgi:ABC-type Fe3+-hydroxamate transport system substrate-binding protein